LSASLGATSLYGVASQLTVVLPQVPPQNQGRLENLNGATTLERIEPFKKQLKRLKRRTIPGNRIGNLTF